jgi:hypothetical protein
VLEIAVVNVAVEVAMLTELQAHKRHHGDDGDVLMQVIMEGGDAEVDAVRAVEDVDERR